MPHLLIRDFKVKCLSVKLFRYFKIVKIKFYSEKFERPHQAILSRQKLENRAGKRGSGGRVTMRPNARLQPVGTTSVQLRERKNGFLVPKRHQIKIFCELRK